MGFTKDELNKMKHELNVFLSNRAKFFLYEDVEVEVEFGEGSIKSWATVLGTISALYAGIANYPSFREGVKLIYNDVNRISDAIVTESLFATKSKHNDVIRVESRTGIVGNLKRIVDDLEYIEKMNGHVTAEQLSKKLANTHEEIDRLLNVLNSAKDMDFVKSNLSNEIEKLPNKPKRMPKDDDHIIWSQIYLVDRRRMIELCTK